MSGNNFYYLFAGLLFLLAADPFFEGRRGGAALIQLAFSSGGAAATNFWVDPQEELVGIFMTQIMMNILPPGDEFRAMTYQALVD